MHPHLGRHPDHDRITLFRGINLHRRQFLLGVILDRGVDFSCEWYIDADRSDMKPNKPISNKGEDGNCTICGVRHQSDKNFELCRITQEFKAKLREFEKNPIYANENGTKEKWVKDFNKIQSWYWDWLKDAIKKRDGYKCVECGSKGTDMYGWPRLDVHHIIPRYLGGSDHPKNLITLCFDCHKKTFENVNSRILSGLNLLFPMVDLNQRTLLEEY